VCASSENSRARASLERSVLAEGLHRGRGIGGFRACGAPGREAGSISRGRRGPEWPRHLHHGARLLRAHAPPAARTACGWFAPRGAPAEPRPLAMACPWSRD
jgi:hypothetical protein